MDKLNEYLEQDILNPKYFFHGSPYEIDTLEPKKSTDTQNKENEDNAVFLTSWLITAAGYAFRNGLKETNEHYDFSLNNTGRLPAMFFQVDNLPDDLYGYVYVFNKKKDMIKDNHEQTLQYRCYHRIQPDDVIKIYFRDFAKYFNRILFQSERIYFTQLSESLVDDYLRMYNNPEIQKTLYGAEKVFTRSQIENWVRNSLQQQKPIFTIINKNTQDFMGIIEIIQKKNAMGEIAVALLPDKQGKGYGQEAIASTLKYGYEKLGLNEYELYVYKANQKAINCYSKVGFNTDENGYTTEDVHMKHRR